LQYNEETGLFREKSDIINSRIVPRSIRRRRGLYGNRSHTADVEIKSFVFRKIEIRLLSLKTEKVHKHEIMNK